MVYADLVVPRLHLIVMRDVFFSGRQGKLLAIKTVSGVEQQIFVSPGTGRTHSIRLFSLDKNLAPMVSPTVIWAAESES